MSKFNNMVEDTLYVSNPKGRLTSFFLDIMIARSKMSEIFIMAYTDILQKYRRSVLGPLWITASTVAFIGGFALLGSIIFGADRLTYISYLAAGIVFWQFIVTLLGESTAAFTNASASITSEETSYSAIILRVYIRNVLALLHNIPILLAVVIFKGSISHTVIYIIPAILLLSLLLISWGFILAILGTRFRDIIPAVGMFLQFMFYFTPIFWPDSTVTQYPQRLMIDLNPFYHVIVLLRAPFIGEVASLLNWSVVGAMTILSFITLVLTFVKTRNRLVYWI